MITEFLSAADRADRARARGCGPEYQSYTSRGI